MAPKPTRNQLNNLPTVPPPKKPQPETQSSPPFASGSGFPISRPDRASMATRQATEQYAQAVHLVEGFADTLDAIPPSLTRSLSDLKELDAVLNTPLRQVHTLLDRLLGSILQPDSMRPEQRLTLLRSIVGEIEKYKLGGEDKIRVANGTCESLSHHISQLDTTMALMISSLPQSLEGRIPDPTFPTGYPKLTGSLRSKPSGGVWCDTAAPPNPGKLQPYISPPIPNMLLHEFVSFDDPPGANDHEPTFDPHPISHKRPKLLQTSSTSHLAQNHPSGSAFHPSPKRGTTESGSILDQHMSMMTQQQTQKRRIAREDSEQKLLLGARNQKSNLSNVVTNLGITATDSQASQPMIPNTSMSITKTKRARTTTAPDDPAGAPGSPITNTVQLPVKKRVRKTTASERPTAKTTDSQPPTLPSTPTLPQYPTLGHPNGKRGPNGASPLPTGESPTTTSVPKRAYTKRAGIPPRKRPKAPPLDTQASQAAVEAEDETRSQDSSKIYCICDGKVIAERMVACDNAECPIEWFHYQCAGLTEDPTGSWFCAECKSKGYGSPSKLDTNPEREPAQVQLERVASNHESEGTANSHTEQLQALNHPVWEGQVAFE
ncbi:hypothetical protein CROQUDRAFT_661669 [Cronartium quercuum f. sp. fusiforme G11]|uniref:Chromatin modification-related protein n=1 Tax=Cronartium quercuum f. sp. fusiforme G11 TaxID=708437 RepID=A0A9P6NBI8_9BASI|nr:hypothetical protein CROQUDRAFT_661669 [Cronartium quercuum f. sp. fusiforme G11]